MFKKAEGKVEFNVQKKMCTTCIYKKPHRLDINKLEDDVRDPNMEGYFSGFRVCHHSEDVCCRGFWNRHNDKFQAGQMAQRLKLVKYVIVDTLKHLR